MRRPMRAGAVLATGAFLTLAGGSWPARAEERDAQRLARRCQAQAPTRIVWPNGTALWGTRPLKRSDGNSSVLSAAQLGEGHQLKGGRLVARGGARVVGAVLQGRSSDGRPVEVAICAEEPVAGERDMAWYRVQVWNAASQEWENPCAGAAGVADPRALVVGGAWDRTGAHLDAPGTVTFACEGGAIAKCVRWGYKPWEARDGQPVAPLHQACTRMARADYCGTGESHARPGTPVDVYDARGLLTRTARSSALWQPERGAFEAAWGPDGAVCLARTRDGRPLDSVLAECPGRFSGGREVDLGDGDRCSLRPAAFHPEDAVLRNRSYPQEPRVR